VTWPSSSSSTWRDVACVVVDVGGRGYVVVVVDVA
jgi:hypothetical protein